MGTTTTTLTIVGITTTALNPPPLLALLLQLLPGEPLGLAGGDEIALPALSPRPG